MILSITLIGCADLPDISESGVSLSFNANGGSGDLLEESSYTADESITLPDDESDLDREGYRLKGWNTQENVSGTDFALGQTITYDDLLDIFGKEREDVFEVTLYAQWEKSYSVIYNGNGADEGEVPDPITVSGSDGGSSITVDGNIGDLVKDEHLWEKWNTDASGDGQIYWEGDMIAMNYSDQELFAFWQRSVTQVSTGYHHTMILKSDGSLWATGGNHVGELGVSDLSDHDTPVSVDVSSDVAAVSTRYNHTMILKSDGSLWATGDNDYGQLGDDSTSDRYSPVSVIPLGKSD